MKIWHCLPFVMCVMVFTICAQGNGNRQGQEKILITSVNTNNTISDVIHNQAFDGFGQFIFPIKNRSSYNANMTLGNIQPLLPYHSNINVSTTVSVINYMLDEVKNGKTIFYNFYTDTQRQNDRSKEATGLFYFRGMPGAPFAVICAGGGFSYVGSIHESFPLALELSKKGYNTFAIEYRVGSERTATEDLAMALSFIFRNAETLGVSTGNYSVWGGSAGARMAANIGSNGVAAYGGDSIPKPCVVVMQYTGHSHYTPNDPPTFAVVGENDGIASPAVMERRINNLRGNGVDVEFHRYPNVGHGFGLGIETSAEGWINNAIQFWEKHISR